MNRINHVVLTRFNLPTEGVEGLIRARESWLQDRAGLFERYCAPSIAHQTRRPTWLVYFDPQSPSWLIDRLAPLAAQGLFRPIFRTSVSIGDLVSDIRESVHAPGDTLITSNLDNDDGLAVDFCERLTAVASPNGRAVAYLTRGLIASDTGVYRRVDRRNAFCSVIESWDSPVTAWSEYHNEFPRVMPAVELAGHPAWLQVVHDANVSNRVRGRLVSPQPYASLFGNLLDQAPTPRASDILRDRAFKLPARAARDGARAAVRVAGLRVLGKERYQRGKAWISRHSSRQPS